MLILVFFFFFQAEDGIRDFHVTGVQTCALPILIYAELSIGFRRIEELEAVLARTQIGIEEIPREALFLAGKAFERYKTRGGTRSGVLPDFFIGAHAAVLGAPLLTRDTRRYADYFPKLELLAPAGT